MDAGNALPKPDGILINGRGGGAVFTGENGTSQIEILFSMNGRKRTFRILIRNAVSLSGKTYMFRISNGGGREREIEREGGREYGREREGGRPGEREGGREAGREREGGG